jgi:uncharacterized protein YjlB
LALAVEAKCHYLKPIEEVTTYFFDDDGQVPNSHLPVLVYSHVYNGPDYALWFKERFRRNGWTNNWRDIVLPYLHFHTTTHEVLAICRGTVKLLVGGFRNGIELVVSAGDVLVLPAGVGHCALPGQLDYEVVGGYPEGKSWDMMTGSSEERELAFANIALLPVPNTDPLFGKTGRLVKEWNTIQNSSLEK